MSIEAFLDWSPGQVSVMTSRQGSHAPSSTGFTGHIRVQPALSEPERAFLRALIDSDRTLRGTPTGRGDRDVPFAHLAWEVCADGCCLTWDPALEESSMMRASLAFLVDHLLRRGAKGEGRSALAGFTFNHVLDGAVMGFAPGDDASRLVEISGNVVTERLLPPPCDELQVRPSTTRSTGRTRRGKLPANVIEFRPRRA
ncbi:hypothetical protein CXG46_19010 [Nocardioides alpinus]|nr:hypothetical protein CXG46_19010 [Nocardioides alpinus]